MNDFLIVNDYCLLRGRWICQCKRFLGENPESEVLVLLQLIVGGILKRALHRFINCWDVRYMIGNNQGLTSGARDFNAVHHLLKVGGCLLPG